MKTQYIEDKEKIMQIRELLKNLKEETNYEKSIEK